jgi:hypothetical protein
MRHAIETTLALIGILALTVVMPVQIALGLDFPPAMLLIAASVPLSMAVIFPKKYKG